MPLIYEFPVPLSHSASPFAKLRPRHPTSLQDQALPITSAVSSDCLSLLLHFIGIEVRILDDPKHLAERQQPGFGRPS
jgi:hypothetical protein